MTCLLICTNLILGVIKIKLGEYELNNIYNEDSYLAIKKIPDKSIDLIYVDVPYLMKKGGAGTSEMSTRAARKRCELLGVIYDESKRPSENLRIAKNKKNADKDLQNIADGFDYKLFIKESFRVMLKCNLFIWCSPMQILDLMKEINKYCKNTITILVWCKTNPIPTTNNLWLSDIEYCLYIRDEGVKLNDGYELKSKFYLSPINKPDKDLYDHPTIKPLELVKRHILHSTQENDIVADFFLGSGTTCVASKELKRNYIGFEVDKKYYDIAKDRINGITQREKEKLEKGQLNIFDLMERQEENERINN